MGKILVVPGIHRVEGVCPQDDRAEGGVYPQLCPHLLITDGGSRSDRRAHASRCLCLIRLVSSVT